MNDSTVVVTDPRLPTDSLIFDGIDTTQQPHYTVSEVAKFFFGRSAHWIRWRESKGYFVFDGQKVGTRRTNIGEDKQGSRFYTLDDIEKMAHSLAQRGVLDGAELNNSLLLLQIQGRIWGYLSYGNYVKVYQDSEGRWRWHVQDGDDRVIASSNDVFDFDWEAKRGAEATFADLPVFIVHPVEAESLLIPEDAEG